MSTQKSLSDVVEMLKDREHEDISVTINKYAGFFVTAGTIAAILIAPAPLSMISTLATGATLTAFKPGNLFKSLHDKFNYPDKGRGLSARQRDEKLSLINILVLNLAARDALKEGLFPYLKELLVDYELEKEHLENLQEMQQQCLETSTLGIPNFRDLTEMNSYVSKLFNTVKNTIEEYVGDCNKDYLRTLVHECIDKTKMIYNAYIVNLIADFPEFALWIDMKRQDQLLNYLPKLVGEVADEVNKRFQPLFDQIVTLQNDYYLGDVGLKKVITKETFVNRHITPLVNEKSTDRLNHIHMHHRVLVDYLNKPILDDSEESEGINFSTNENMYIPQSYKLLTYSEEKFAYDFLLPDFWDKPDKGIINGEDVGGQLLKSLLDPNNATKPLLILGNPGAGKSMLSQIFAARLCESHDFVPFFVKLRDVASSNSHVVDHINQGLSLSLPGRPEVDWFSWVKECDKRIPVLIMDGFDELLQASPTMLNGYLSAIRDLQKQAYVQEISLRVIITSRLSIMKDITIPRNTTIIKLEQFDDKRINQWIEGWNKLQTKSDFQPFRIPDNNHIIDLSKEPLLLLLLAVYDFENAELQMEVNKDDFNQSKLYDKLFQKFTIRQLRKDRNFSNLNEIQRDREILLYRLRLGLISLMMFLRDSTNHNEMDLTNEIEQFELNAENIDGKKVFSGFFFIHENKATREAGEKVYNFEFLHKTFGEFLAADFLLRVANSRVDRSFRKLNKEGTFRFCFGYNWLNKHPKIVSFLFEHSKNVISLNREALISSIYSELELTISSKNQIPFPVNEINVGINPLTVLEHLSIYSQNLVLLLVSLNEEDKMKFELGETIARTSIEQNESKLSKGRLTQGELPKSQNALLWRTMVELWNTSGNNISVAKLLEWINVDHSGSSLYLVKKRSSVEHFFSNYSKVAGNNYNMLLSLHQIEKIDFYELKLIIQSEPRLLQHGLEVIYHKFEELKHSHGILSLIDLIFVLVDKNINELVYSNLFANMLVSSDWDERINEILLNPESKNHLAINLNSSILRSLLEKKYNLKSRYYEELMTEYLRRYNNYSELLLITEVLADHFSPNRPFVREIINHLLGSVERVDFFSNAEVLRYLKLASRIRSEMSSDLNLLEEFFQRAIMSDKSNPKYALRLFQYAIELRVPYASNKLAFMLFDDFMNNIHRNWSAHYEALLVELIIYCEPREEFMKYIVEKVINNLDTSTNIHIQLSQIKALESLIVLDASVIWVEDLINRVFEQTTFIIKKPNYQVTLALLDFVFIHCRVLPIHEKLIKFVANYMLENQHGLSEKIRFVELVDSYGPRIVDVENYLEEIMEKFQDTRSANNLLTIEDQRTLHMLWRRYKGRIQ